MNRNIVTAVSVVIIAFIVHISGVLMLPYVAPEDVWTRLGKLGPVGGFKIHNTITTSETADPNADPAIVMAICRYDLSQGPFRISGDPALWYWGLALHNNRGFIYYSINNRAIGDNALDLRILSEEEYAAKQQEEVDEAAQEFIVPSPTTRGYVVLRSLIPEQSARSQIEETVKKIGCAPYKGE